MATSCIDRSEFKSPPMRVLACLDGSSLGERALPHALAIARALGAPVTLLQVLDHATNEHHTPADPLQWEIHRREAREYMDRLIAQFDDGKTIVDAELIEGKPAEEICRWSAGHQVGVTVVTTHGAGGRSPWVLASTARKLLERAPGSFLIVPAAGPPVARPVRYERVLVPLDGSPQAEIALPIAAQIAAADEGELIVAHVVPVPELTQIGPLEAEAIELSDRLRRRNERVARAYLDRLRAQLADAHSRLRVTLLQGGDVAGLLAGVADRERVDLVAVAAHGRSGHLHMPCGGITAELIARSRVPVLVVRSRSARATQRIAGRSESPPARLPRHAIS
ncbi:MAG: universal stress protein [Myxococcota bacterium]